MTGKGHRGRRSTGTLADVRYAAHFGLMSDIALLPKWADAVEKVFLGVRANFYRGAGAAVRK